MKQYALVVPKVLNFTMANKLYFIWTCYPKVAIQSHQKTGFILSQGPDSYLWEICWENSESNCFKEIHNSQNTVKHDVCENTCWENLKFPSKRPHQNGNMKTPIRKIPTCKTSTTQENFNPENSHPATPTQENSHSENSHLDNSHPGKLPPGKLPPRKFPPRKLPPL